MNYINRKRALSSAHLLLYPPELACAVTLKHCKTQVATLSPPNKVPCPQGTTKITENNLQFSNSPQHSPTQSTPSPEICSHVTRSNTQAADTNGQRHRSVFHTGRTSKKSKLRSRKSGVRTTTPVKSQTCTHSHSQAHEHPAPTRSCPYN